MAHFLLVVGDLRRSRLLGPVLRDHFVCGSGCQGLLLLIDDSIREVRFVETTVQRWRSSRVDGPRPKVRALGAFAAVPSQTLAQEVRCLPLLLMKALKSAFQELELRQIIEIDLVQVDCAEEFQESVTLLLCDTFIILYFLLRIIAIPS